MITLIMLEIPGKQNQNLDHLMVLSKTSPMLAHQMRISLSTCARILLSMVSLVWLGWEQSVDQAVGKDTKLLSMRKEKVLFQQLR